MPPGPPPAFPEIPGMPKGPPPPFPQIPGMPKAPEGGLPPPPPLDQPMLKASGEVDPQAIGEVAPKAPPPPPDDQYQSQTLLTSSKGSAPAPPPPPGGLDEVIPKAGASFANSWAGQLSSSPSASPV